MFTALYAGVTSRAFATWYCTSPNTAAAAYVASTMRQIFVENFTGVLYQIEPATFQAKKLHQKAWTQPSCNRTPEPTNRRIKITDMSHHAFLHPCDSYVSSGDTPCKTNCNVLNNSYLRNHRMKTDIPSGSEQLTQLPLTEIFFL